MCSLGVWQVFALLATNTKYWHEMAKGHNSFFIPLTSNGMVLLYLDPTRFNYVLIRPALRDPIFDDILSNITNICYMTITDVSLA